MTRLAFDDRERDQVYHDLNLGRERETGGHVFATKKVQINPRVTRTLAKRLLAIIANWSDNTSKWANFHHENCMGLFER